MKVAVLHLGRNGGGPKFTFELANGLSGAGVEVLPVIAASVDNRADFEALGPVLALTTFKTAREAIIRAPLTAIHGVRLLRRLRHERVDAVVVGMEQIWQAPILLIARLAGRPIVLCVHDATMHPGEANPVERGLRSLQRRAADGFVVFSAHVGAALDRTAATRPVRRSVHGAFGGSRARLRRTPPLVPVVGFFGRLAEYKGLDLGYAAVEQLRREGRRVRFRVVGSGTDPSIDRMRHPDDDLHIGWTDDSEIPSVLDGLDLLLLPYREASQSGVLAYAMAAGLPAVVTPVGGLVEQARTTGAAFVASAVHPEAVADALRDALDSPDLYGAASAAGLAAADGTHSWGRVAQDVLATVRAIGSKPGTRRRPAQLSA